MSHADGETTIEELFARYRERGDVNALGAVFDRTAPELFRIAQHLARDVHTAEDAVQAAFLTALDDANAWDARRPLLPWLLGVLANRVREARRRERAPTERAARDVIADAESDVHARELAGAVDEALGGMPELYRDVLARHLRDGHSPAEIASALGRAPGTVRVQLARGLEQLRRALPPSFALAGAAIAATGRGHAAVREAVVERAAELAVRRPRVPLARVSRMPWTQLGLVTAAALVATIVWLTRTDENTASIASATSDSALAASAEASAPRDSRVESASTDAARVVAAAANSSPRESAPSAPGIWIVGRVIGLEHVDPARIALLAAAPDRPPKTAPARVQADRTFAIDVTELARKDGMAPTCRVALTLTTDELVDAREELDIDAETIGRPADERVEVRHDVQLEPTCGVRGRVVRPEADEESIIAALYALHETTIDPAFVSARAAPDGRFELRTRVVGPHRLLLSDARTPPTTVDVELAHGRWTDIGTLTPDRDTIGFAGHVVLPHPLTPAGALVAFTRRGLDEPDAEFAGVALFRDESVVAFRIVKARADGSFEVPGLSAGEYDVELEHVEGVDTVLAAGPRVVTAPTHDLRIGEGLRLVTLDVRRADGAREPFEITWKFSPSAREASVSTHRARRYLVPEVEDAHVTIRSARCRTEVVEFAASGRGAQNVVSVVLAADDTARGGFALVPDVLAQCPARVRATLTRASAAGETPLVLTLELENGVYTARGVPAGDHTCTVEPGAAEDDFHDSFATFAPVSVTIARDVIAHVPLQHALGGRIRARWTGAAAAGATARVLITHASGAVAVPRAAYRNSERDLFWSAANHLAAPLDRECELFPNLPPGAYRITLDGEHHTATPVIVDVHAGRVTTVDIELAPR